MHKYVKIKFQVSDDQIFKKTSDSKTDQHYIMGDVDCVIQCPASLAIQDSEINLSST